VLRPAAQKAPSRHTMERNRLGREFDQSWCLRFAVYEPEIPVLPGLVHLSGGTRASKPRVSHAMPECR